MNEIEKEQILRLLAEGTLRPEEAAKLLAALAEEPKKAEPAARPAEQKDASRPSIVEVQMRRADGTLTTVEVPSSLVPMFWQMAKVAIKESARTAAQETWSGFRHIVHTKTEEVKTSFKAHLTGGGKQEETPAIKPAEAERAEARHRILQMVQNGRITAADAGRLLQELDAFEKYRAGTALASAKPQNAK